MALHEFKLPDPGEGLLEAEIVDWKVAVGDTVAVNDIVVEIETAKSLVELPIPWAGTVAGLHVSVGDEVAVGTVIITIDDGEAGSAAPAEETPDPAAETDEEPVKTLVGYGPKASGTTRRARRTAPAVPATAPASPAQPPASVHVSQASAPLSGERLRALAKPPVRKLAKDLGVDLALVDGSGEGGIVTRADVEAYAARSGSSGLSGLAGLADVSTSGASAVAHVGGASHMPTIGGQLQSAPERAPGSGAVDGRPGAAGTTAAFRNNAGGAEQEVRIPIKGVRKMTAQAMVASAFTAPHVTEWVQVDVTATMDLVARLKTDREFRDVKVTPLTILAKAVCLAIRRNPGVNATWDEAAQEIVEKRYVHLGIAAATPRGLLVPNVKHADTMTLVELAGALNALTATAREGRTSPADQSGGTITVTNVGVFGVDGGTPILNPGEAAILAFGQVRRMPWVVGQGADERIEPRSVTTLALSFDHRLVDGELGSKFLADVAAIMADPARALVWG